MRDLHTTILGRQPPLSIRTAITMPTLARLALSSRSDSNNRAVGRRGRNQFLSEIPADKSSLLHDGLAPSDRCQRGVKAATQGPPVRSHIPHKDSSRTESA